MQHGVCVVYQPGRTAYTPSGATGPFDSEKVVLLSAAGALWILRISPSRRFSGRRILLARIR
jgi:hypothetical protein